jgi:hypothetical protein
VIEFGKDVTGEAEETSLVSAAIMTAEHRERLGSFMLAGGAVRIG